MGVSLEVVKDTYKIRKHDMSGNRMLTNELIVDEIMLALGYNKKIDTFVKRLYDGVLDWEVISPTGNRIALRTVPVGEDINISKETEAFDMALQNKFVVMLLSNGEMLYIYGLDNETLEYVEISRVNLLSELSSLDMKVLVSISKDGFDNFIIKDMVKSKYLTTEKVVDIIKKYSHDISELIGKNEGIENLDRLSGLITEIACGTAKIVIDNSDKDIVSDANTATEDTEEVEEMQKQLSEFSATIEDLTNRIKELVEAQSLHEESLRDKDSKIQELAAIIDDKEKEIEELSNLQETSKKSDEASDDINGYIEKINELASKIEDLREENEELQRKNNELQRQINELDGADRKRAQELLDIIQVDESEERQYVGVINTELYQYNELNKFIGASLQKLYEIKNFEASQFIFNGELFELVQPSIRNDLMMNKKTYDINIEGLNEDVAINKLRIVFSHFEDIVFDCKKVGSLSTESNNEETFEQPEETFEQPEETFEQPEETFEQPEETSFESQFEDEGDLVDLGDLGGLNDSQQSGIRLEKLSLDKAEDEVEMVEVPVELSEQTQDIWDEPMNIESQDNIDLEQQFELGMTIEETDIASEYPSTEVAEAEEKLYVVQMLSYGDLILTDEQIEFNTVKYIGTNNITFAIRGCDNYDKVLCKSIDALMAIGSYSGRDNIIKELKMCSLSDISDLIKRHTSSYSNCPKITGTKYCVSGVETIQQLARVIYDFCTEMSIDMSELFLYVTAKTNSDELNDKYGYNESEVIIYDNIESNQSFQGDELVAVIKGDWFNRVVLTQASLNIHSKLFRQTVGVKTKYLTQSIRDYSDVIETIRKFVEASISVNINEGTLSKCTKLDGVHKIISTEQSEVTPEHDVINVNNINFFVSKLEEWEIAETLVRLHTEIYNDTAIGVKLLLNSSEWEFITTEFNTSEPSLALAIDSIKHYLKNVIK